MRLKHNDCRKARSLARNAILLRKRSCSGVTLVEVVLSLAIVAMSIGGIMTVYTQAAVNAEWSAHSLAAHMMAVSGLEQARAAKYDPRGGTDELVATNFPVRVDKLDTGTSLGVCTYGTNTITISTISTNPAVKMIKVDCTWTFPRKGVFTNSVYTYRGANQ
jgi:Tfp pilus assembly protein PilV